MVSRDRHLTSAEMTLPTRPRHTGRGDAGAWVFAFFAFVFLLTSSGRLNNYDPEAQLQAATAVVATGRLGVEENPMPEVADLWIRNRSGRYYEAHDLGGLLFMVPAGALGMAVAKGDATTMQLIREPPMISRVVATWQYGLAAALGAYFLFALFRLYYPPRTSLLLVAVFVMATPYWAYARVAFDVMGSCVGICLLLWACGSALRERGGRTRHMLAVVAGTLIACTFRFSLTPFILAGLVGMALPLHQKWGCRRSMTGVGLIVTGLLPCLAYNALRTEELLKTGATGHYPVSAALHGTLSGGLYGLILSPNWGLLWFAPIFFLLLLWPFTWRNHPSAVRQLFLSFSLPAIPYLFIIAKLNNWTGNGGWGPRYLVPLFPILFLGVAPLLVQGCVRHRRPIAVWVLLSCLVNAPAVLVNYRMARGTFPGGWEPFAQAPWGQMGAWAAVWAGIRSVPGAAPAGESSGLDQLRGSFPDFWEIYLIKMLAPFSYLGWIALVLMLAGAVWCGRRCLDAIRAGEAEAK